MFSVNVVPLPTEKNEGFTHCATIVLFDSSDNRMSCSFRGLDGNKTSIGRSIVVCGFHRIKTRQTSTDRAQKAPKDRYDTIAEPRRICQTFCNDCATFYSPLAACTGCMICGLTSTEKRVFQTYVASTRLSKTKSIRVAGDPQATGRRFDRLGAVAVGGLSMELMHRQGKAKSVNNYARGICVS